MIEKVKNGVSGAYTTVKGFVMGTVKVTIALIVLLVFLIGFSTPSPETPTVGITNVQYRGGLGAKIWNAPGFWVCEKTITPGLSFFGLEIVPARMKAGGHKFVARDGMWQEL